MGNAFDLIGKSFNRLTVEHRLKNSKSSRARWLCRCICGNRSIVTSSDLTSGHIKSCGCYNLENVKTINRTHGRSRTKVYEAWGNMRRRCYDKTNPGYKTYGAMGITVCDEWRKSFEAFYADMGEPPSPGHSLDRIDYTKGYSPENCRWATISEQANNKSVNRLITYNGKTQNVAQWANEIGISKSTMHIRFKRWSVEDAITRRLRH